MRRTGLQAEAGSRPGPLQRPRAAFSIVELMVVVGILSLLMAILVPAVREMLIRAEVTECIAIVGKLSGGCEMHKTETGYYPGQDDIDAIGETSDGKKTGSQYLAMTLFDPGEKWSLTHEAEDLLPDEGVSDRFSDPMPVLYFPAELGKKKLGQYHVNHNIESIRAEKTEASDDEIGDAFDGFITDTRTGSVNEPYNPKGYLIIAAGKNRQYLDSDDVTSFRKR